MLFRIFLGAACLAGGAFSVAAHAESSARPAAAAGLYECQGANGGTVFRAAPQDGCRVLATPDPAAPDPQRWLPLMAANGVISYFDQSSVRRRGTEVGVVVMRNAPPGVIKTANGETIGSSLRRIVLNCATSMSAIAEQTLYAKRYARGESLYTIRAPNLGMPQPAVPGTIGGELLSRLCH